MRLFLNIQFILWLPQSERQLRELYALLAENYVEFDGDEFRFDYSPEFLRWCAELFFI